MDQEKEISPAALRQRKSRERRKTHMEAMKAEELKFNIYHGTRSALDRIKPADMEDAEFITLLIHAIDSKDGGKMAKLCGVSIEVSENGYDS